MLRTLMLTAFSLVLSQPATAQDLSEPEINFEHLWQTFDRNYGIFGPKKVDWDALYALYRPRVDAETSDDELFEIMSSLLGHLNDNHVRLSSPVRLSGDERRFQSGILGQLEMVDFSLDLVVEKYLSNDYEQRVDNVFTYGWLTDSIGYFHFRGFGNIEGSTAAIDEIIAQFQGAEGIVVDVRSNGGGNDRVGKLIADRFADRQRLYMVTSIRNGPEHDDFSSPRYWNVEPDGPIQFTKPVILLTHRHSVSAAENFALAMRVLPNVTVVGETTSGVFADVYGDRLPNGWRFSVSYKLFVDYTGFCWEGIGVPPDIRQINTAEDIQGGQDRVLQVAIDLLNTGALGPQDERGSVEATRESLVRKLGEAIRERGIDEAIDELNAAKLADSDSDYFDREEMELLAEQMLSAGRVEDALRLLEINAREFPDFWEVHDSLAEMHVRVGNTRAARASFQRTLGLNRRSYPWEVAAYERAAEFVREQVPEFADPLERFVQEVMNGFEIPGVTVGVTRDGDLAYAGGFGVRNIETGEPMRPEYVFHMASVSKPFVATAIMQLVEKGAIDLDAPVTKYLPYFELRDDRYALITIRQMLNHTSGMPDVQDYEWDRPQFDERAAERYVRSLADQAMIAAPGERFRYSNMAFDTLGDVIAKVSGQSFESYMKENILDPLGMTFSTFIQPDVPELLRTTPHIGRDEPAVSAHYPYNRRHAPSSTLNSSVVEMGNWALANLNRGELNGRRILREESYEELWTPSGGANDQVGLSWFVDEHRGRTRIGHDGADTGYRSNFAILPEENLGVIVASNYSGTPMGALADGILDVLLGYEPTVPRPPRQRNEYDVLIRGGTVFDGTGQPRFVGDLAIEEDRIVAIGDLEGSAELTIDGEGLYVTPGFFDMHSHSESQRLANGGQGPSFSLQGITTEIYGETSSMGPVGGLRGPGVAQGRWTTLGEFLDYMEEQGMAANFGSYVGSGGVRAMVMGYEDREPMPEEVDQMKVIVEAAMRDGALGVSSGMSYVPNIYMSTAELTAVISAAAPFGGIYATHARTMNGTDPNAIREAIAIARGASVPLHFFHLNSTSSTRADEFLAIIDEARSEGMQVTGDSYAYTWGITGLSSYIPAWAQEGGTEAMLERLRDPEQRTRIAAGFVDEPPYLANIGWHHIRLGVRDPEVNGKLVSEVAEIRGQPPEEVFMDVVLEQEGSGIVIDWNNEEETLRQVLAQPFVAGGTDGGALGLDWDSLPPLVHPRHLGTFPRWLGTYVQEVRLFTWEEAIRKLTSLPASILGLEDRGRLAEGYFADVLVIDPDSIRGVATFEDPFHYSEGMRFVFVNGEAVVAQGELTGALPGRAIRGKGWSGGR